MSRATSHRLVLSPPAPASIPGCRRPAVRYSCLARRPGYGYGPHRPAGSSADRGNAQRCGGGGAGCAIGLLEGRRDMVRMLLERHELGVPFKRQAEAAQAFAHDPLVVVLAEDQDVGIRGDVAAGHTDRHMGGLAPFGPEI